MHNYYVFIYSLFTQQKAMSDE